MRSKYKKFSERDREAYVKEFAELKKQTGISKYKYAIDHEIPVSTFKRWVKLYQEYIAELVPATVEEQPGSFIMISDAEEKPMIVTDIGSDTALSHSWFTGIADHVFNDLIFAALLHFLRRSVYVETFGAFFVQDIDQVLEFPKFSGTGKNKRK